MSAARDPAPLRPAAGLVLAPAGWSVAQMAAYASTPLACAQQAAVLPLGVHLAALCVALAGATISFRASRRLDERAASERFLALVGVGTGLLFAFAIALQGAADLINLVCHR